MNPEKLIYLDNNATTRMDPRVLDKILPFLSEDYGNAASTTHPFGWRAADAVTAARKQVAELIGASEKEIIWTSGATESDNIATKGVANRLAGRGRHIVTATTEHKAILDSCAYLEKHGFKVTYLQVDPQGLVSANQVLEAVTDETILVTLMLANNEIGSIHPIAEIGQALQDRKLFFHCDATQAVGKIPIDVNDLGVDLLSLSGHKFYGPKGVGALYVRQPARLPRPEPSIHGGGHERGVRSGTLNVPGIVGMGAAAELARLELDKDAEHCRRLRDHLEQELLSRIDFSIRNGHPKQRLPNTSNISFKYVEGESLMMRIPKIAVSSGSACTSANLEPSYVLRAMGIEDELAHCSIRFSLGRFSTIEEIDQVIPQVEKAVEFLRNISPLYADARKAGQQS